MVDVSEDTVVGIQDLRDWYLLKKELTRITATEAMMRRRIASHFFPVPDEGVNKVRLNDGTDAELKVTHVINRKVNEGELAALKAAIAEEGSNLPNFDWDKLIKYEPKLSVSAYRKLSDADKEIFERVLEVKPGMPQMEITIPKRG